MARKRWTPQDRSNGLSIKVSVEKRGSGSLAYRRYVVGRQKPSEFYAPYFGLRRYIPLENGLSLQFTDDRWLG